MAKKKPRGDSRQRLEKIPATVYLDPTQATALDEVLQRTQISKSKLLREAVDLVLDRYSPENMLKRLIEQRRRK